MRLLDGIVRGAQRGRSVELRSLTGASYGGGYGYGLGNPYGSQMEGVDYNREAGLRYDNSIVYSILSFYCTALNAVPLAVARLENGKPKIIPDHPLTQFLSKPNPWYDGSLITSVSAFCEGARGNSYSYKHRNANTYEVVALEVVPDGQCWPYTIPGSGDFISEYRITTPLGYMRVPPDDVLQIRWMTPYPQFPVLGMSPLDSALPDLVADKLSARHEASILRNSGVSSISVAPMVAKDGQPQPIFTANQQRDLKASISAKVGGDNKGEPMIWAEPVDIKQLGFDPKQLLCTEVRYMAETRLCSVFGVQPVVLGMASGLEKSNNRASIQGAIDITLMQGVLPYMRHRANQLSEDLIPELGEPGEVIIYNEAMMPYLKDMLIRQVTSACGGAVYSINEGRDELGLKDVPEGVAIRQTATDTTAKQSDTLEVK